MAQYPTNPAAIRNIRIWHANRKRYIPRACFVNEHRAHMRSLLEADQAKPGLSLEIVNTATGEHLATYTSIVGGVKSWHSPKMRYLLKLENGQ